MGSTEEGPISAGEHHIDSSRETGIPSEPSASGRRAGSVPLKELLHVPSKTHFISWTWCRGRGEAGPIWATPVKLASFYMLETVHPRDPSATAAFLLHSPRMRPLIFRKQPSKESLILQVGGEGQRQRRGRAHTFLE